MFWPRDLNSYIYLYIINKYYLKISNKLYNNTIFFLRLVNGLARAKFCYKQNKSTGNKVEIQISIYSLQYSFSYTHLSFHNFDIIEVACIINYNVTKQKAVEQNFLVLKI